jgi:hypothetical protein
MHSVFRHFVATVFCGCVFTAAGTGAGFLRVLHNTPNPDLQGSLVLTGFVNFVMVCVLSLVVLTPVTSIAQYLFERKWSFPAYVQVPILIPLLSAWLLPWALFFGRSFLAVLISCMMNLTLPVLIYWAVLRGLDRDDLSD